MTKLFSLLRREDGIALPTAMMVLTLCLLMTAVVAEGADQLSKSSGTDQRGKRALAAADAGVDVAIRRLRAQPDVEDTLCPAMNGSPATGVTCAMTAEESLGNGAFFQYTISAVTVGAAPSGCYQVPGQTIPAHYIRRCITATGRVGNEIRRVQEQVVSPPRGAAQWMGILGMDYVEIRNSAQLSACWSDEVPGPTIGSNLTVTIDNSSVLNAICPAKAWGVQMPAGRSPTIHWGAQPNPISVTTAPAPFTILPPPRDFEDVETTNDNLSLADSVVGSGFNYQTNNKYLRLNNGGSLRLTRGGDFIVCSAYLDNSSNLDFSTTEKTRIWVDSPLRPGSSCPGNAIGFQPQMGARINWPSTVGDGDYTALTARAKNVEIYSYSDITIRNTVRVAALIQADRSTVQYVNGSLTWGAVAAKRVILENSGNFQRPTGLTSWGPDGPPYRSAGWTQCRSMAQPAATPHAGC